MGVDAGGDADVGVSRSSLITTSSTPAPEGASPPSAWWTPEGPWVHHVGREFDPYSVGLAAPPDSHVVILHWGKIRDKRMLMLEFVRGFNLPDYFGGNWSALEDCLQDLTWLEPKSRYLLVIDKYDFVLDGDLAAREALSGVLVEVGGIWSSIGHGDGPVGFNSVLVQGFGVVGPRPFWSCEAEKGEGAGLVPGCLPEAGGMLRTPVRRRAPIARFLQVAIALGAFPVRNWEASSAPDAGRADRRRDAPHAPRELQAAALEGGH